MVNLTSENPSTEAPTIITTPPQLNPEYYFETKLQSMFDIYDQRLKKKE